MSTRLLLPSTPSGSQTVAAFSISTCVTKLSVQRIRNIKTMVASSETKIWDNSDRLRKNRPSATMSALLSSKTNMRADAAIRDSGSFTETSSDEDLEEFEEITDEDLASWEDGELDEIFEKYGTVVRQSKDVEQPLQTEQEIDEETKKFAIAMAGIASEGKGGDILALYIKSLVYWARCFVIITAFSKPQIEAIRNRLEDAAEEAFGRLPISGDKHGANSWTLLDYGDVVIHILLPSARAYYNLEEFYGNGTLLDLPFEQEKRISNLQ